MSNSFDSLESRRFFSTTTGVVDSSFGAGGVASLRFTSDAPNDKGHAVDLLVDHGDRAYVVDNSTKNVEVRRVNKAGVADGKYANDRGLLNLPVPTGLDTSTTGTATSTSVSAALDPADRLYLLVGAKLYRFTVSGKTDRTFGTRGVADLSSVLSANGTGLAIDSANRLYVSGLSGTDASGHRLDVVGLRSNGLVSRGFGSHGVYVAPAPDHPNGIDPTVTATYVRVASNDTLVAAAATSYTQNVKDVQYLNPAATGVEAVHFTAAGQPDPAYGGGVVQSSLGGSDVDYAHLNVIGIRSTGAVVIEASTSSADSQRPTGTDVNRAIDFSGKIKNFVVDGRQSHVQSFPARFYAAADGSDYVFTPHSATVYHRETDGTFDATFTGGTLRFNSVGAFAVEDDGSVLTLSYGSKPLSFNLAHRTAGSASV